MGDWGIRKLGHWGIVIFLRCCAPPLLLTWAKKESKSFEELKKKGTMKSLTVLIAALISFNSFDYDVKGQNTEIKKDTTIFRCNRLLILSKLKYFTEDEFCQMRSVYKAEYPLYIFVEPNLIKKSGVGIYSFICYHYPTEISFSEGYKVLKSKDKIYINSEDQATNIKNVKDFLKQCDKSFNTSQREAIYQLFINSK